MTEGAHCGLLQLTPIAAPEQSRVGAAFATELFLSWGLAWVWSDPCAAGFSHERVLFAVARN